MLDPSINVEVENGEVIVTITWDQKDILEQVGLDAVAIDDAEGEARAEVALDDFSDGVEMALRRLLPDLVEEAEDRTREHQAARAALNKLA